MVIDKIENYKIYAKLGKRISKAFDYLNENDLNHMELGKHVIDNDDIFALVQKYDTKDREECKLEGHYKYIDIQYIIKGSEIMGVTSLTNQEPIYKNENDDYAIYSADTSLIRIDERMFAIFFPDDLHMPCIKLNQSSKVKNEFVAAR